MASAVRLREDYPAAELRTLARRSKNVQPEPAASIAGCGRGWNGSGRGGEDRWDGPPDLA